MASLLNISSLRQGLTASLMDGLYSQWNQIKMQVVTQIASNVIGAPVSVEQIQQQTETLETQYNDLSKIFEQVTAHQDELFEIVRKGCLSSTKSIFGSSVAETISWMAALGLGVCSMSGGGEKENVSGDATKGLSILLFVVSQAISKFNDYNNYKKVDQYKTAQKSVVQAREIIKQRHLLETAQKVTHHARALLAPGRSFEEETTLEEKAARWVEMQKQLQSMFTNPSALESADQDSVIALRSYSTVDDVSNVESMV